MNTDFGNVIDYRSAIEQIVTESLNDPKIKQFPVNHFLIDFRYMINITKVRSDLQDSKGIKK